MDDDEKGTVPKFDKAAVWGKIQDGIRMMQHPPPCVMGALYIGPMRLQYDISGTSVLTFSNDLQLIATADVADPGTFVCAEALGYGRQVGILTRDRVLMHCMLADYRHGTEPWYMLKGDPWPHLSRVDFLLCLLNQIPVDVRPCGEDLDIMRMAQWLLRGQGNHYNG